MTLRPKKHLGQNFLADRRIQQKIVDSCDLRPDDVVVEIGPGQGVMTRSIAPRVKELVCIETDKDLVPALNEEFKDSNVSVVHADFLKWDMAALHHAVKVIGNIPYYISTPIIEKLIEHRRQVSAAYLTVQLEFGRRLAAGAGSKDYGSLSCFIQYYADVKVLFTIKNSAFKPAPKVDSCFVRLDFSRPPAYHPKDEQLLFRLVRTAFTQRRKTLVNAVSTVADKERLGPILADLGISAKARPEELNLDNFVDISDRLV